MRIRKTTGRPVHYSRRASSWYPSRTASLVSAGRL